MKVRSIVLLFLLLIGPASIASALSGEVTDKSKVCMMQDSIMGNPGIAIEHDGKTYYGCCSMCSEKIKNNAEKYTKAEDPISGKKVDKALAFIYNDEGRAIYFELEANRSKFEKRNLVGLGKQ